MQIYDFSFSLCWSVYVGQFMLLLHLKPQISARIFVKSWFKPIKKTISLTFKNIIILPNSKEKVRIVDFY
jgi:hypothetical protein